MSISVVIPNYNGIDLLKVNIPAIYNALNLSKLPYEIIVADDASTDASISFLEKTYSDIKIIRNEVNQGFAPTANKGIFACNNKLVFMVNSDVLLTSDYFSPQLKYFEDSDTFGVMGRIIGLDNDKIQDAGKIQNKNGLKIGSDHNKFPTTQTNDWFPSLYLSGANALMNREKLLALGGFDEIYKPFYGEDLDLSLRAWKVGWKCYYEHNSICRHPNSVTINKYNNKKKIRIVIYKNRFLMHFIHLSGLKKLGWNLWLVGQLIVKILTWRKEFLLGFQEFLKLIPAAKKSKENLFLLSKKTRIAKSNKEVYKFIDDAINKIPHDTV